MSSVASSQPDAAAADHAIRTAVRVLSAALVISVIACRPSADAVRRADSTSAAASLRSWQETGATLSARDEAQSDLEDARMFFLASDVDRAAAAVEASAEVARRHAADAAEPAKSALLESAAELGTLASQLADDGLDAVPAMDSTFARHHLAEAQLHCTRAEVAWAANRPGATSAEMLALADHFERAARDVGYALTATDAETLSNLRSIAAMLSQTGNSRSPEVSWALSRMDKAVHALMGRVAPRLP